MPDNLDYGKNALGFRSVNIISIISFYRGIYGLIKEHFASRNSTWHSVWLLEMGNAIVYSQHLSMGTARMK